MKSTTASSEGTPALEEETESPKDVTPACATDSDAPPMAKNTGKRPTSSSHRGSPSREREAKNMCVEVGEHEVEGDAQMTLALLEDTGELLFPAGFGEKAGLEVDLGLFDDHLVMAQADPGAQPVANGTTTPIQQGSQPAELVFMYARFAELSNKLTAQQTETLAAIQNMISPIVSSMAEIKSQVEKLSDTTDKKFVKVDGALGELRNRVGQLEDFCRNLGGASSPSKNGDSGTGKQHSSTFLSQQALQMVLSSPPKGGFSGLGWTGTGHGKSYHKLNASQPDWQTLDATHILQDARRLVAFFFLSKFSKHTTVQWWRSSHNMVRYTARVWKLFFTLLQT